MKIILDTSFLITSIKYKARIFTQLKGKKVYVIDKAVEELKEISKKRSKDAICAKISLKLLKKKKIKILLVRERISTDPALVNFSKKGYIILTQDRKLKKRIKKVKGKHGTLRQRKIVII